MAAVNRGLSILVSLFLLLTSASANRHLTETAAKNGAGHGPQGVVEGVGSGAASGQGLGYGAGGSSVDCGGGRGSGGVGAGIINVPGLQIPGIQMPGVSMQIPGVSIGLPGFGSGSGSEGGPVGYLIPVFVPGVGGCAPPPTGGGCGGCNSQVPGSHEPNVTDEAAAAKEKVAKPASP